MIFEIANELQAKLTAQDCPVRVFCAGDKKTPTGWTPERVVVDHDLQGTDSFTPPRSQRHNPKHSFERLIAATATIYAKAPAANATQFEHRARAERILHQVLAGMRAVAAGRKNQFSPKSGEFFTPKDAELSDTKGGAAYVLKFTFEQAVKDVKWSGAAKPEGTLARVTMAGAPTLTFAEVGATSDTITRSAGSWLTDGFAVGMTVSVRGTQFNNISAATITALTATVMTLDATDLTAEVVSGAKVVAGGTRNSAFVSIGGATGGDVPAEAELVWEQN